MKTSDLDILFIPGWSGSGPDHWQSRWEQKLKTALRVEQDDWYKPDLAVWTGRIAEAVAQASRPVVLVAHSLGVHAVAHAASRFPQDKVKGAFLVTPPSGRAIGAIPSIDHAFALIPRDPLPFPSVLVGSRTDEYCTYDEAADMGLAWGSVVIDAGEAGHINVGSGHGPWPEGLMSFAGFLRRIEA